MIPARGRRVAARHLGSRTGSAGAAAVALGLGLLAGLEPRGATPVRWCVVGTIGSGLAATLAYGRGRQRRTSGAWLSGNARAVWSAWRPPVRGEALGATIWVVLILGFVGWDLFSFSSQRADLATLSHYLGMATATGWGRGPLAAGWVAWGAWVALGWRKARP